MQPFTAPLQILPVKTGPEKEVFLQVLLLLIHFVTSRTLACCVLFLFGDNLTAWGAALKSERMYTTHMELGKVSQCRSCVK